jgi:hypothetical protein
MAVNFLEQNNPTPTNMDKATHRKVVKLVNTDFVTGGVASVKAVLPSDSTIISMSVWYKTKLSGGGITAATLSIGIPGTPTYFVSALDVLTPNGGTSSDISAITNIMVGLGSTPVNDYSLLFTGTATTGNPTAGELYVSIVYVR